MGDEERELTWGNLFTQEQFVKGKKRTWGEKKSRKKKGKEGERSTRRQRFEFGTSGGARAIGRLKRDEKQVKDVRA